ncbi:hypothetical protein BKH42_08545 [Helicobacter sp. 13S00482-2]|uniref:hypothetical protein n=1 Tax=Helicobacter sp. 13S00482-2 TaxID=1476200 RepID=UPI000BA69B91|nr:hypothetical protein [Helicobacter sp. 13S00482-2]PAF52948.1 hypothetical protein BKH42_08545 [Helicobacter sp. 13S00482-2]
MTKIDLENNIVEFEHNKALKSAFLLLSYVHQMEQFKKESPKEFLQNWAEEYENFLKEAEPSKKFRNEFKSIREKNKKMLEEKQKYFLFDEILKISKSIK